MGPTRRRARKGFGFRGRFGARSPGGFPSDGECGRGDYSLSISPFRYTSLGTPPALAYTQPQLRVAAAEEAQSLRGAGQGRYLRWAQQRQNAHMNVLREIEEVIWSYQLWMELDV
ncbi:hypothetical protein CR513_49075, partial [Mucuna pruriens]